MKSIFNDDQFEAMINHAVSAAGIATATSAHQALYQILGGVVFLLGLLMSHRANATGATPADRKGGLTAILALFTCLSFSGCSTTTTTTPGPNGSTTVTKSTGLDPDTLAQVDAILSDAATNAPAVISDIQAVSALVHGTNSSGGIFK